VERRRRHKILGFRAQVTTLALVVITVLCASGTPCVAPLARLSRARPADRPPQRVRGFNRHEGVLSLGCHFAILLDRIAFTSRDDTPLLGNRLRNISQRHQSRPRRLISSTLGVSRAGMSRCSRSKAGCPDTEAKPSEASPIDWRCAGERHYRRGHHHIAPSP